MSSPTRARQVRRRARQIRKANKPKMRTKDYLQRALVVLIILAILGLALLLTQ